MMRRGCSGVVVLVLGSALLVLAAVSVWLGSGLLLLVVGVAWSQRGRPMRSRPVRAVRRPRPSSRRRPAVSQAQRREDERLARMDADFRRWQLVEQLAARYDLPNPSVEKFEAQQRAILREISSSMPPVSGAGGGQRS